MYSSILGKWFLEKFHNSELFFIIAMNFSSHFERLVWCALSLELLPVHKPTKFWAKLRDPQQCLAGAVLRHKKFEVDSCNLDVIGCLDRFHIASAEFQTTGV